jgi:ribonucleoside-diphosphate reductase alpha chain
MAKEGSTVGGLIDVIGTCVSMALQYGVPLITLVEKFRHARFEPAGMTSNKDIPFAKSLIDYIFCWLGCRFIPGYAEKNLPNQAARLHQAGDKTTTTAKQLVEKTKDLAKKIAEAKAAGEKPTIAVPEGRSSSAKSSGRFSGAMKRVSELVGSVVTGDGALRGQQLAMQQFLGQFEHFQDDAPPCDVCGAITVRNGTCYRCHNCGNSMGCS